MVKDILNENDFEKAKESLKKINTLIDTAIKEKNTKVLDQLTKDLNNILK